MAPIIADDLKYSTRDEEESRSNRKKPRIKDEDYRYNSDSSGPNGTPQKSSFGSSFFSNSSAAASSKIDHNNVIVLHLLLLIMAYCSTTTKSSFAISC